MKNILFSFFLVLAVAPNLVYAQAVRLTTVDEMTLKICQMSSKGIPSSTPIENVSVVISNRKTDKGDVLPDLKLISNKQGKVTIPLVKESKRISFKLGFHSENHFIPDLEYRGGNLGNEMTIPAYPLKELKGHFLRPKNYQGEISPIEIHCRGIMSWNVRPFIPTAHIDKSEVKKDGSWSIKVPSIPKAASNLVFSGESILSEYYFLGHSPTHPRFRSLTSIDNYSWDIDGRKAPVVKGQVVNESGQPMKGVIIKARPLNREFFSVFNIYQFPKIATDENGKYSFNLTFESDYKLTASTSTMFYGLTTVSGIESEYEWNIQTNKPATIIGTAFEKPNKALAEVNIRLDMVDGERPDFTLVSKSDSEGNFSFKNAPRGQLKFVAQRPQSYELTTINIDTRKSDKHDVEFMFNPPFELKFEVVDSLTEQPIDGIKLIKGTAWNKINLVLNKWDQPLDNSWDNGQVHYAPNMVLPETQGHRFLVVADGYAPYDTGFISGHGKFEQSIKLDRAKGPHGIIIDENGQPIENCHVFMTGIGTHQIGRDGDINLYQCNNTKSDRDGRFELKGWIPDSQIIAISERGFATTAWNFSEDPLTLKLSPHMLVTGTLKKSDGSPRAFEKIRIVPENSGSIHDLRLSSQFTTATTDENGTFSLDGIPPIPLIVRHISGKNNLIQTQGISLRIKPTTTGLAHCEMGGFGANAKAQLNLPGEALPFFEKDYSSAALVEIIPQPSEKIRSNPRLYHIWMRSAKNKERRLNQIRRAGEIMDDGIINFYNVPSGRFHLVVVCNMPEMINGRIRLKRIANFTKEVTIDNSGLLDDATGFDLGLIP